jgi:hypothetical protein
MTFHRFCYVIGLRLAVQDEYIVDMGVVIDGTRDVFSFTVRSTKLASESQSVSPAWAKAITMVLTVASVCLFCVDLLNRASNRGAALWSVGRGA